MTVNVQWGTVEADVRCLCVARDYHAATTLIVELCGAELFRFVRRRCAEDADAEDVFSMLAEDLWRGLPDFAWRCSLRTWLYTLARHAGQRFRLAPHRRVEHNVDLAEATSQLLFRGPETDWASEPSGRSWLQALRRRLRAEDRAIVSLRVDQELGFREIAERLAPAGRTLSEDELARAEARVRKRFQLAMRRLRAWAGRPPLAPPSKGYTLPP